MKVIENYVLNLDLQKNNNNGKIITDMQKAEMLIRKNLCRSLRSFYKPEITTKFWFTKSSGRLDENKNITWTWEMYNVDVDVEVTELQPNQKISILWGQL